MDTGQRGYLRKQSLDDQDAGEEKWRRRRMLQFGVAVGMVGIVLTGNVLAEAPKVNKKAPTSDTLTRQERYQRAMDAALWQEIERVERQVKDGPEELAEARRELKSIKKSWKEMNKRRKKDKVKLTNWPAHKKCVKKVRSLTDRLKESKKRLRKLKKGEIEVRPRFRRLENIEVGQIGMVPPGLDLRVFQVLGDDEMLVEERRYTYRRSNNGFSITPTGGTEQACVVRFRGVSTKGLIPKREPDLGRQIFEVTGTSTYRTATGGSNTVFVLEPFKIDWLGDDQAPSKSKKKRK